MQAMQPVILSNLHISAELPKYLQFFLFEQTSKQLIN